MGPRKTQSSLHIPVMSYVVKVLNLISSVVVAAIMAFFTYHLQREGFRLPWTFIVVSGYMRSDIGLGHCITQGASVSL
jgi:hypothetical protein